LPTWTGGHCRPGRGAAGARATSW